MYIYMFNNNKKGQEFKGNKKGMEGFVGRRGKGKYWNYIIISKIMRCFF